MNPLVPCGFSVLLFSLVSACGIPEGQSDEDDSSGFGVSYDRVTDMWVSSTVEAYVLREMFARGDDEAVIRNIVDYGEERREFEESEGLPSSVGLEALMGSGVIAEVGGGYEVAVDVEEWDLGGGSGVRETEVRQAMIYALEANEVDWCGDESIDGYEFVMDYVDSYGELHDTREDCIASIEGYVECGSE